MAEKITDADKVLEVAQNINELANDLAVEEVLVVAASLLCKALIGKRRMYRLTDAATGIDNEKEAYANFKEKTERFIAAAIKRAEEDGLS